MAVITVRLLSVLVLLIGFAVSASLLAQSGSITFTGRIVAPACTGSADIFTGREGDEDGVPFVLSLTACAQSRALVARSSVSISNQVAYLSWDNASVRYGADSFDQDFSSAIVTVTWE